MTQSLKLFIKPSLNLITYLKTFRRMTETISKTVYQTIFKSYYISKNVFRGSPKISLFQKVCPSLSNFDGNQMTR